MPAIGASVIAEKEGGVITSVVKEGGYTANSFVTVDGSYSQCSVRCIQNNSCVP